MGDVTKYTNDGTEYRQVTLRVRETGIKEMLVGLGESGFCSAGSGRVHKLDGEIFFEFCFNVGRYDTKVKAMALSITIPLTEEEDKFKSPEAEQEVEQEEKEDKNETPPDP